MAICNNRCGWLGSVAVNWERHIHSDRRMVGYDAIIYSIVFDYLRVARWKIFEYVEPTCISGMNEVGTQKVN